jgi:hypothetical protein
LGEETFTSSVILSMTVVDYGDSTFDDFYDVLTACCLVMVFLLTMVLVAPLFSKERLASPIESLFIEVFALNTYF